MTVSGTVIAAWLVHAYTASGLVLGLLAARAVIDFNYRAAFFWLWLQVVVDATDGVLARRMRAAELIPWFDGAKLDDLVDYLAYVAVPALLVWRALLVPDAWTMPIAAAMLVSSGYGFSRRDAKTPDHFFTGFPSYWNIVVFYLLLAGFPSLVNAAVLAFLAFLVFVPIRYVYPSRTPTLRRLTNVAGGLWSGLMLWMLWQYPAVPRAVFWISLAFPAYYVALSLWLNGVRPPARDDSTARHGPYQGV
jgi:phosphatidylcholine synthase